MNICVRQPRGIRYTPLSNKKDLEGGLIPKASSFSFYYYHGRVDPNTKASKAREKQGSCWVVRRNYVYNIIIPLPSVELLCAVVR
jgi:hypothetical protein